MPETSPFYLTRQLANTMEELATRSRNQTAVFCISGSEGIGKSRLIARFLETRSQTQEGIIFSVGSGGALTERQAGRVEIDRIHESMEQYDLVFIDQTEQMDCQQISNLVGHWKRFSLTGKVCMLVLVGRTENYCAKDISSLLTSGQLFEFNLKPMSIEESEGFLRFRLGITDDLQLQLNSAQRSALKKAKGNFDELARLSDSLAGAVSTRRSTGRSIKVYLVAVALALVLLAAVRITPSLLVESEQMEIPVSAVEHDVKSNTVDLDFKTALEPDRLEPLEIAPPTTAAITFEVIGEDAEASQEGPSEAQQQLVSSEAGGSTEQIQLETSSAENRDILTQRLQATSDLIARSSDKTGTIQLITLVMDELNWTPIVEYLDQLGREGIDLDNVFVYKRERERRVILGILYGEYENTLVARDEIPMLPEKLLENSPFPRSIRGIKKEMLGT